MSETTRKKKLIEVALPLDEINAACKADKDRKTGTLRNLHKWFAPMPLPAWRALLFAALVDDPEDDNQRVYLLDLIKRLVANGADLPDGDDLEEARMVLAHQFPHGLPMVWDPFCGGGSTLIESQRLGLKSKGSDLNPVPALITRALTEVLPPLIGRQPLHPEWGEARGRGRTKEAVPNETLLPLVARTYSHLDGLMCDTSYYAEKVSERAWATLGRKYPANPGETPVAYFWVRTVRCPNPTCGIDTPLCTSWWLSKREGSLAWIAPKVIDRTVVYEVEQMMRSGSAPEPPKIGDGVFRCLKCSATLDSPHLRAEGKAGRISHRLVTVIAEKNGKRIFRPPISAECDAAYDAVPSESILDLAINVGGQGIRVGPYGINTWRDLFIGRQAESLEVFADAIRDVRQEILDDGGDMSWADAIITMLALALGKLSSFSSTENRWFLDSRSGGGKAVGIFGMPTLPMTWDFVESYPFGSGAGSWAQCVSLLAAATSYVVPGGVGVAVRGDARSEALDKPGLVATDPPYFEAIGYADLSDYFYVWHRHVLRQVFPDLYATIATPKEGELIASPARHQGSSEAARNYFISGFTVAFENLKRSLLDGLPMLVVYASKEQKSGAGEETRWSSILTAMINAELEIAGTWPIRGTRSARMRGFGSNAVASYIVMVCRPRSSTAETCSLADFNRALRRELGPAVRDLQAASILPVDLAQAAMGPGMRIFSRYRSVLDQSGGPVSVEQALRLINAALSEVLDEQEGELDPESRFAVRWWETYGWELADFGEADKTARPLGISVDHVKRAQVAASVGNKIHLLGIHDMDRAWTPSDDIKPTAWEAVHHLADRLVDGGGELGAADLMAKLGQLQDPAMALAYRLHDIAAKKGRTSDQERYNALISSWSELIRLSSDGSVTAEGLF